MSDLGIAIGRAMMALIFIISGFGKLTAVAGIAGMLQKMGFPQPQLVGYATGVIELVGGLMMLFGFMTRWAALVVLAFTAATIYLGHPFWTMEGAQYAANRIHALKNVAMIGGFLVLAAVGPGRFSIDGARR
jgi:putative oxidoreductase